MNAMLFAHHADIFAAAMRTQEGKEKYTALDYFRDRFALRYGGTDMRDGFAQSSSARRLKEDMLAWKQKVDDFLAGKLPLHNNVVMRTPLVFDLIGADSTLDIAIDRNILQKLVDKHHFTRQNLLELPKKIADPLFVLRAIDMKTGVEDTQKRIVVIDMEINGATVMVPFVVNTAQGMNKIASAYGREKSSGQPNDQWYIDRLNQKNLLYINKNRTARWVATRTGAAGRHNAPLTKQSFSTFSIADENDLSKQKKENPGFYQSAYHGSPHDFVEFLLSAIGTGEGAQAHGWGLYFAKAKKTAASYRGRLSSKNELEIVYDGKKSEELTGDIKAAIQLLHLQGFRPEDNLGKFIKTRVKDYTEMIRRWENRIREIDNTLSTNAAQAAQAQLYEERKDNVDRVAASKNVVRQLKLIDPKKAVIKGAGSLFHVEIPDNDVLLDEDKSYTKQPLKVREALEKLVRGLTLDQLENWNDVRRLGKSKVIAEIMDALSESNGMNIYGTISDLAEGQKEASVLLNQYGIKGITYGGQEDGRCFVIFDDKAISIIEKFNQMLRQEVRGEISKEDGKRIITLFESADESTFMHEMGHMFLMDLDELAKMDEASAKELETVNAWAEWHEGAAEEYKDTDFADEFRAHESAILAAKKSGDVVAEKAALERWRQERFARGFEMYLSEGKAPSAAMRSVFRRFKAFLRKIYNLAKNAGAMPSVEVQAVMARMIATENEIAEAKLDERFRPIEKLLGKESVESLLGETEACHERPEEGGTGGV